MEEQEDEIKKLNEVSANLSIKDQESKDNLPRKFILCSKFDSVVVT